MNKAQIPLANQALLWWGLVLGWMGLIFIFSHQPTLPQLPSGFVDLIAKKVAHALAYAILMGLWWQALRTIAPSNYKTLFLALTLTVLYAASDEWHQTFIPGRNGQLSDVLIDSAGALLVFIKLIITQIHSPKV